LHRLDIILLMVLLQVRIAWHRTELLLFVQNVNFHLNHFLCCHKPITSLVTSSGKHRATRCVFSHAKIEITSSKGVRCTRWENIRTCRSAFCRRHLIGW